MRKLILPFLLALVFIPSLAGAHCQVPCGIYDDPARVQALREDAATIAKASRSITELSGRHDAQSANQLSRWVATKEAHASHIIEVVAEYFLAQRVRAGSEGYAERLADHHSVIVAAMKAKQGIDAKRGTELEAAIETLAVHYH